ncbi:DUF5719 family protein [Paramicrobacterium chengjingii]|uniref:DUF5719 family protein n=1 Tax=Paramicrobacterium chengjingii TaxID=2769067 RepID=UPI00141E53DA|nr:DUF5719 family protein [Microbacterium chengjingii]
MTVDKRLRFGMRIGAGAATAFGLAVLVGAALVVDLPHYSADASQTTVTPEAADQLRTCPGSVLEVGKDAAAATALTPVGSPKVVASDDEGISVDPSWLKAPDVNSDEHGPATLTLPTEASSDTMSGSQSQSVETDTLAGFAAAECQETSSEAWLVAGSTDIGRTSLVMLNNPSGVDATVDIAVTGENGPIDSPNGLGIVVEAGTQKVVSLAGIAPNTITPVVHVTSTGADIQSWVQQSSIRGLVPAGIEMAGRGADPSESTTIPGVQIYSGQPETSTQEYDDRRPALRVFSPSGKPTHVSATITDESGKDVSTMEVDITKGAVGEYPLGDLPSGRYSIHVDASQPVVAAARTSVSEDKAGDFSWFASAAELETPFVVDAASGPGRSLVLHNASDTKATVEIGTESVTIDTRASYTYPLEGPVTVTPDAGVLAVVSYAGGNSVSSFTITAPKPASEPIDVSVR